MYKFLTEIGLNTNVLYFQTTEAVYQVLFPLYEFQCRGQINVKGKGEMTTYFLMGRKAVYSPTPVHIPSSLSFTATPQWKRLSRDSFKGLKTSHGSLGNIGNSPAILQRQLSNQSDQSLKDLLPGTPPLGGISIQVPSLGRSRLSSEDSPQLGKGTPPGSLGRRRKAAEGSTGGGKLNPIVRKLSNSGGGSQLAPPVDPNQSRVESPDLPLVHYRNTNMQAGGGGSLGRGNSLEGSDYNSNSTVPPNTLTQSQILGGQDQHRSAALSSSPKRALQQTPTSSQSSAETVSSVISATDSPSRMRNMTSTNSEPLLSKVQPRRVPASPTSSHSSMALFGNLPKIEESHRESKYSSSEAERSSRDDERDAASPEVNKNMQRTKPNGRQSPTRSELSELDHIMKDFGWSSRTSSMASHGHR